MSAIYFVPVDHHRSSLVERPMTYQCGATRGFTDHDYSLHTYAPSPFDDLASVYNERARAAAIHQARAARKQAELRAVAAREQELYEHQVRLRRAYEEHLLLQQRARAIEEAQLRERQRRVEIARSQEARRLAAIAEHRRRRLEHHSKAQTHSDFEEVIGHFIASAFGQLFDSTVKTPTSAEAADAKPKENDPTTEQNASKAVNKTEAAPVAPVEVTAAESDSTRNVTQPEVEVLGSNDAAATLAPRPASPAHSDHSANSSRSSSRGRSRQPRVRDVDENGEEIVLPQDSADEE